MIITVRRSPESKSGCESYGLKRSGAALTGLFSIAALDLKPKLNPLYFDCGDRSLTGLQLKPEFLSLLNAGLGFGF